MRILVHLVLASGLVAWFALGANHARAGGPDPSLEPTQGSVKLKAGFRDDPFTKKLLAGGSIKTKLGGPHAFVAKEPDFRLHYTAGTYPLRISVESKGDTTLLINLPNETWLANNDGGSGKNPQITINKPQSGQYDIWVGTVGKKNVDAILKITERVPLDDTPKAKTITLIRVDWFEYDSLIKRELRVYQIGQNSEIYKTSRGDSVWRINQGPWAVTKKGIDIQLWEINNGLFEKDKRIGSVQVPANVKTGVHEVPMRFGKYEYTVKYRID